MNRMPVLSAMIFIFIGIIFASQSVSATAICQFATGASATSENNLGSLAMHARNVSDAPMAGFCSAGQWSGYGYAWSPQNWNIKANLTLTYPFMVNAINLTIIGDYDMCWRNIWLRNSQTGQVRHVLNGFSTSCVHFQGNLGNFTADTLILETCGWSWSSTDAVQLCGSLLNSTSQPQTPVNQTNQTNSSNSTAPSLSIKRKIYLSPYIGDIDGSVPSHWFSFYNNLTDFHTSNQIPDGASFYPGTMNSAGMDNAVARMYSSPYIELIQKGYDGGDDEWNSHLASYEEQRQVAELGRQRLKAELEARGFTDVKLPVTYNLLGGRFTNVSLRATQDAGFNQYLDVYYDDNVGPTRSTATYDVVQYGISFTTTGWAGKDTTFRTMEQIYEAINNFQRLDVNVKTINGTPMVPIWVHQQDFVNRQETGLNDSKWDLYRQVMLALANDPNVTFILPKDSYAMTHPNVTTPPQNQSSNQSSFSAPSVCAWKDCKAGAVSFSVDDGDTSCAAQLEAKGYRGTYYLSGTHEYTRAQWQFWERAFQRGHEIASHTRYHWCIATPDWYLRNDVEWNIQDIINNTNVTRSDIVTHAYPCGFVDNNKTRIISSEWNFIGARGYNHNMLESATPQRRYDLKSFNSHGYPGGDLEPPSYFQVVDEAESRGEWANLAFHNACDEDGVLEYLPSKKLWVDTVGNVLKYSILRDNATISQYASNSTEIRFNVIVPEALRAQHYRQNITVKVPVGSRMVREVTANNVRTSYTFVQNATSSYALVSVPFPTNSLIKVSLQ